MGRVLAWRWTGLSRSRRRLVRTLWVAPSRHGTFPFAGVAVATNHRHETHAHCRDADGAGADRFTWNVIEHGAIVGFALRF